MPASSIAALLDFEGNFEDALRAFLLGSGYFGATHQILTPRTLKSVEDALETPRVTIAMTTTASGILENQRTSDGAYYQANRQGQIQIVLAARRDGAGQAIGTMRGLARKAMLEATAAFDGGTLPYYSILTLIETGSVNSIDAANDEILCALTYAVDFFVKPDAWPAS